MVTAPTLWRRPRAQPSLPRFVQIHDVKDPPRERDAPATITRFDSPPRVLIASSVVAAEPLDVTGVQEGELGLAGVVLAAGVVVFDGAAGEHLPHARKVEV